MVEPRYTQRVASSSLTLPVNSLRAPSQLVKTHLYRVALTYIQHVRSVYHSSFASWSAALLSNMYAPYTTRPSRTGMWRARTMTQADPLPLYLPTLASSKFFNRTKKATSSGKYQLRNSLHILVTTHATIHDTAPAGDLKYVLETCDAFRDTLWTNYEVTVCTPRKSGPRNRA